MAGLDEFDGRAGLFDRNCRDSMGGGRIDGSALTPHEGEQIRVQSVMVDSQHPMRKARISLKCAVLQKLN